MKALVSTRTNAPIAKVKRSSSIASIPLVQLLTAHIKAVRWPALVAA